MKFTTTKLLMLSIVITLLGTSLNANEIVKNTTSTSNAVLIAQNTIDKYIYGYVQEYQSDSRRSTEITIKDGIPQGIGVAANPRLRIINLGAGVNSQQDDYAPSITSDGKLIFFASNRNGSKELPNGNISYDFWAIKKSDAADTTSVSFSTPYNIDESTDVNQLGVNTILNEGVIATYPNTAKIAFTGCNRPDGYGDCDIYLATNTDGVWSEIINGGKNLNSEFFDSQPSVARGGTQIYFTSTRPGANSSGNNKEDDMDIWYCDWDEDMEEWKPAINIESVNSVYRDCSPFIAPDKKSLIFSSDRPGGSGGLDFYVTYYDETTRTWSSPENLGKPLNTAGDDQFITLSGDLKMLYFSSTRSDISDNQGNLDLYLGWVPLHARKFLVKGTIVDGCTNDPITAAQISITNKLTGKKVDNLYNIDKQGFWHDIVEEDYGTDIAKEITIEITATHPRYASQTVTKTIQHYPEVEDPNEADQYVDSLEVVIPMGEMPTLTPVIAEADYISKAKIRTPELAKFRGLVMEEILNWSLYPLLTYVFFDEGASNIPNRYQMFKNASETRIFTDTTIAGKTLDKYYHILNIFGFRLNKYPTETIEIVGNNDATTASEKRSGLSKERADNVYNYLKDIWNISPDRMKLVYRDIPASPSNKTDSLGMIENRRVEIVSNEWEIFKPVFDKDVSHLPQPDDMVFQLTNGLEDANVAKREIIITRGTEEWITLSDVGTTDTSVTWDWTSEDGAYPTDNTPFTAQLIVYTKTDKTCKSVPIEIPVLQVSTQEQIIATGEGKTKEDYSLILFAFGSDKAGPVNERVMNDYVYGRVFPTSDITVTGHTDIVGLFDANLKLSQRRANTVRSGIQGRSGGKYKSMNVTGVGPENPLYPNDMPEGRFYNRTVHVQIESTIDATTFQ